MAQNRKRNYNSAETLAFILGDIDIPELQEESAHTDITNTTDTGPDVNSPNYEPVNTSIIAELQADISRLDEDFDRGVLQNVANNINRNFDFEIEPSQ